MPEQGAQAPLQPWKVSENPFQDDNCYKGQGYAPNWWFRINPSSPFSVIMDEVLKMAGMRSIVDFDNITKDTKLTDDDIIFFIKKNKNGDEKIKEGAEVGNLTCQLFLAAVASALMGYYKEGTSYTPEEIDKIYGNFEKYTKLAAEQGHVNSQCDLGQFYLMKFLEKDDPLNRTLNEERTYLLRSAKYWYEKAAANGSIQAKKLLSDIQLFKKV